MSTSLLQQVEEGISHFQMEGLQHVEDILHGLKVAESAAWAAAREPVRTIVQQVP
jgi:hypothetical protein